MPAPQRFGLSPKALLRFVLLLAAACLIGALIGLVTEPLGKSTAADPAQAKAKLAASGGSETKPADSENAAAAADAKAPPAAPKPASGVFDPDLRGLYVAGGVLALFLAGATLLVKRTKGSRPGNGAVHLVDTLHLGGGRLVHLVRVEGRKFLLGNSERGVHFLASVPQNEFERAVDAELGATADERAQAEGEPTFDRILAGSSVR